MKNNILPAALLIGGGLYLFTWLRNKADAGQNLQYEPVDIAIDSARSSAAMWTRIFYTVKLRLVNNGRASVNVRDIDLSARVGNSPVGTITSSTAFSVPANSSKVIQLTASISTTGIVNVLYNIIEDGINIQMNIEGTILTDLGFVEVQFTKQVGTPIA